MPIKLAQSTLYKIVIVALTALTSGLNLDDGPGEDVAHSRLNYEAGRGSNFLGGFASTFYAMLPNLYLDWWQYLIIIQVGLAGFGTYLFFKELIIDCSKKYFITTIVFSYLVLNLSAASTRDGMMIASTFAALGIASQRIQNKAYVVCTILFFVFAFTFRPWLAFAFIFFLFYYIRHKTHLKPLVSTICCIALVTAPSIVELIANKNPSIKPGYPQQTVMIHDLASTFCLSPIPETRKNAYNGLIKIVYDKESLKRLCIHYKPNTWQSSVTPSLSDPLFPSSVPPLKTIAPGDEVNYQALKSSWIELIISDPSNYLQNHLYFLTQVLIGGESPQFSLKSSISDFLSTPKASYALDLADSLYDTPWKIFIQLHFLAPIITFTFIGVLYARRFSLIFNPLFPNLVWILLVWIGLTTLGYVSDNGRYTYLPSLIFYAKILEETIRSIESKP